MLLLALVLAATTAAAEPPRAWDGTLRYRVGHDPSWSARSLDESQWIEASFDKLPQPDDSLWVRLKLDLTEFKVKPGHPFGIYFGGMASHEIWWDGEKIGGGGVVGRTKASEVPGPIEAHYHVPDRLIAPGMHTVAIRMSVFHRGFSPVHGYWGIQLGNYDRIIAMRTRTAQSPSRR